MNKYNYIKIYFLEIIINILYNYYTSQLAKSYIWREVNFLSDASEFPYEELSEFPFVNDNYQTNCSYADEYMVTLPSLCVLTREGNVTKDNGEN